MDFSLFYILHITEGVSESKAFDEAIEQCVAADELGYKSVWFAEHHFSGVGIVPDPLLLLAAVAQRTRRIRLGTAISILPFHNPVRLAEQAAMVDVLSGGRLELGVGRGSQPKEFLGFQARPSESRERLKEGLEMISRLLGGEKLTFSGKYFSCKEIELHPRPIQKPIPIWLAGTSPETYTYAGENGYFVMASAGFTGPEVYKNKMGLFREAVSARGGDTSDLPYPLVHHLHVCGEGEDEEEVFSRVEKGEGTYLRYRSRTNDVDLPEEEAKHLKRNWSYELNIREIIQGGGAIGSAEKVIEDIRRLRDDFGVNHVLVAPWRGPSHQEVLKSLERFAREVMPALQEKEASA